MTHVLYASILDELKISNEIIVVVTWKIVSAMGTRGFSR